MSWRAVEKVPSFFQYSSFVKAWFLPVWLGLGIARLAILTISFKRMVPRLGVSVGVCPWLPLLDERQEKRARMVGQVIRLSARYTPWESNCFPQAIVARVMLGFYRVPYCFFFGVRRSPTTSAFDAHAWVATGRVRVIGGVGFNKYTTVGVFVSPRLKEGLER